MHNWPNIIIYQKNEILISKKPNILTEHHLLQGLKAD